MKRFLVLMSIVFSLISFHGFSGESSSYENSPYGICHLVNGDYFKQRKACEMLKSAGITMMRSDIMWPWNQANKEGIYNFHGFDREIYRNKKSNLLWLPILNQAPDSALPLHEHLDEWSSFVTAYVQRYREVNKYWEIWNEHNFTSIACWGGKDLTTHTKNYTALLKRSWEVIKGIDPSLKVVYGGTAYVPCDYIEECLKLGAGKYFDVMNVHPYQWPGYPEPGITDSFRRLKILMKRYGLENKPIWATEIGWPTITNPKPKFYKQLLPIAFKEVSISPENTTIVFLDHASTAVNNLEEAFPKFKDVCHLPYSKLKDLDPTHFPLVVPCGGEVYPNFYKRDLLEYVRRGGTIILPESAPFQTSSHVYDANSVELTAPSLDMRKELHLDVIFAWEHGFPETDKVEVSEIPETEVKQFKSARFLSDKNLHPGDRFIPLAWGEKGDFKKPIAAVYKYNSELKGNVIAIVQTGDVVRTNISEEIQAKILPRAHLLMFAEGVQKVFWYCFASSGIPENEPEANFGIVNAEDLSPKLAYKSYCTLTKMYPAGSKDIALNVTGDGLYKLYRAKWIQPNGNVVHAIWTPEGSIKIELDFTSKIVAAYDYLGKSVNIAGNKFEATSGITYFVCKP